MNRRFTLGALAAIALLLAPTIASAGGLSERFRGAFTRGERAACTTLTRPIEVPGSMELDAFCYSVTLDRFWRLRFSANDSGKVREKLPAGTPMVVYSGDQMDGILQVHRWDKVRFRTKARDLISGLAVRDATLKLARAYHNDPETLAFLAAAYPAEAQLFVGQVDVLRGSMVEAGIAEEPEASLAASKCEQELKGCLASLDGCIAKLEECEAGASQCRATLAKAQFVVDEAHGLFELLAKHASAIEDQHHGPELLELSIDGMKLTQIEF